MSQLIANLETDHNTHHIVSDEVGNIILVCPASHLRTAQECARQMQARTGLPHFVHTGIYADGNEPTEGQTISMAGLHNQGRSQEEIDYILATR